MTRHTVAAAAEWLAAAHPTPAQVMAEWAASTLARPLVPAAVHWDAIMVPHPLAAGVLDEMKAAQRLAGVPVLWDLRDGRSRIYLLVPPGTAAMWHEPPTRAVGESGWLAMPYPAEPAERRVLMWKPPPTDPYVLADPSALRTAIYRALRSGRPAGGER